MDEKPRVLVDVDGVLNLGKPEVKCHIGYCHCHPGWRRYFGYDEAGVKFKLGLTRKHGVWLHKLASDTGAELAWYTSWNDHANTWVADGAGLAQLPVVTCPPVPPPLADLFEKRGEGWGAWKAQKLAKQARWPFVWFDDQPDARYEAIRHVKVPHLVVTVDPRTGLTEDHVDKARAWLLDHASTTKAA